MTTVLILGSNWETVPLIEAARSMGIQSVVVDHIPESPGKRYAARSLDISGTDIDAIVAACGDREIDGVCVGVADRLVVPAARIASLLKKPTLATPEACEVLNNKNLFNDACRAVGLQTIPERNPRTVLDESPEVLSEPLFVKPVDANSGKGMSVCATKGELLAAIEHAYTCSQRKQILVERYMQCDDTAVHLTIVDGSVHVSALVDRYTAPPSQGGSRVCIGAVYQSRYSNLFRQQELPKLVRLLKDVGIHNGLLTIQAFVENNRFYFYDPGFRLQGEGCDHHFARALGYDQKKMLLRFSHTGRFTFCKDTKQTEWTASAGAAATIWLLIQPGTIGSIIGLDDVAKISGVFRIQQRLFPGETVTEEMVGTERQVIFRVYVRGADRSELQRLFDEINTRIDVLDIHGNSLSIRISPEIL